MDADDYAASMVASLTVWDATRPRSLQQAMGVSSVGLCRAQALWMIMETPPTDAPEGRQALMGTAVHAVITAARAAYDPSLVLDRRLDIQLPSGITLTGAPDEINCTEPGVTDYKTVSAGADMASLRRNGATEQQRFQRHLYYLGALQAGLVPEQGTVRNIWVDRSGQDPDPFVEQEPFSMEVVNAADTWLTDVLYAAEHGEEPLRDKHYDWCSRFCRWFSHCRENTHPDLVVTDAELLTAAADASAGREMAKAGKALEEHGRRVLEVLRPDPGGDVQAYVCGEHRVRWSWINSDTAAGGGYYKLALEGATP